MDKTSGLFHHCWRIFPLFSLHGENPLLERVSDELKYFFLKDLANPLLLSHYNKLNGLMDENKSMAKIGVSIKH